MGGAYHDHIAHGRILPQGLVAQYCALNLFRTDAVAGDVNDVIGSAVKGKRTLVTTARVVTLGVGEFAVPSAEIDLGEAVNIAPPVAGAQRVAVAPQRACQIRVGLGNHQFSLFARFSFTPLGDGAFIAGFLNDAHLRLNPGQRPGFGVGIQRFKSAPRTGEDDPTVLSGPVGIDVMRADIVHREPLHGGRHGFGAEGSDLERRHVIARHFLGARRVCHHGLEESRPRFEQGHLVALDNRRKSPSMGEERRALCDHCGHAEGQWRGDQIRLARNPARVPNDIETIILIGIEDRSHGVGHTG